MKEKFVGIFWGIVLVIVGGYFLVTQNYSFVIHDPFWGMALNAGLSLLFFASYFLSGKDRWGWLFPACIFAGTTTTIALSLVPLDLGGAVGAPVLLGVGAPFLVAYLQQPDKRRWALIPMYVMVVLSLITIIADRVMGEWMGSLVLLAIALPFLVVFLMDRTRRWALIPFGIMAVMSLIPLMTTIVDGVLMGVAVCSLFALAFAVVYFLQPQKNWWAIIPAGVFASSGVAALLTTTIMHGVEGGNSPEARIVGAAFFLCMALTFTLVWLKRASAPTAWGLYPASVFVALAILSFFGGEAWLNSFWPVVIIGIGIIMIFRNYMRRTA